MRLRLGLTRSTGNVSKQGRSESGTFRSRVGIIIIARIGIGIICLFLNTLPFVVDRCRGSRDGLRLSLYRSRGRGRRSRRWRRWGSDSRRGSWRRRCSGAGFEEWIESPSTSSSRSRSRSRLSRLSERVVSTPWSWRCLRYRSGRCRWRSRRSGRGRSNAPRLLGGK